MRRAKSQKKKPAKGGVKYDKGKPRMSLLSPMWVRGVAEVLTKGEKKYAAHNWRLGLGRERLLDSLLRHAFDYLEGKDVDQDPNCAGCKKGECLMHTGLSNLLCLSCCAMFAYEMHMTRPDLDDRFKKEKACRPHQRIRPPKAKS